MTEKKEENKSTAETLNIKFKAQFLIEGFENCIFMKQAAKLKSHLNTTSMKMKRLLISFYKSSISIRLIRPYKEEEIQKTKTFFKCKGALLRTVSMR